MKNWLLMLFIITAISMSGQEMTGVSLFLKKDGQQIDSVYSQQGDLFRKLGHHGPAVENQWCGYRIYFDKKAAIDVYSKARPGLELKEKKWYPSKNEQMEGWGADYYKAGNTVGLGGIRLWDGEKIVPLHPVSGRWARVEHTSDSSWMEMVSEGVPYMGKKVDVRVRVTVYNDSRTARVEADAQGGDPVQFVTGINYFDDLHLVIADKYVVTWGMHPEDVAAEKIEVGAALILPETGIRERKKLEDQYLLVTEPTHSLSFRILSANAREPWVNSLETFLETVELQIRQ